MSRRPFLIVAVLLVLLWTVHGVAGTEEKKQASGLGTGAAKLENGDVICTIGGAVVPCISPALPPGLRKSLAAMLTRGFETPPDPACPQPICPQPICYERGQPDDWLGVPNRPGDGVPQRPPR